MVDKQKTIRKAQSRYHSIIPIPGKHALEECFFCLRGRYYFQFKTKDKKVHTMKAVECWSVRYSWHINREALVSLYKALNKPILIRSLIMKHV